jgi:hypothetical protein
MYLLSTNANKSPCKGKAHAFLSCELLHILLTIRKHFKNKSVLVRCAKHSNGHPTLYTDTRLSASLSQIKYSAFGSRCALRIWLEDWFRPVSTNVDITSNNFYKCTATFRTHCIYTVRYKVLNAVTWRRVAWQIGTNTHTQSDYVTFNEFPRQQRLGKSVSC